MGLRAFLCQRHDLALDPLKLCAKCVSSLFLFFEALLSLINTATMVKIIEGNERVCVCETNESLSREEEEDIRVTAARCPR